MNRFFVVFLSFLLLFALSQAVMCGTEQPEKPKADTEKAAKAAPAAAKTSDWTVLEGKVMSGQPWTPMEDCKIMKSADGNTLKIECGKASYKMELKEKKLYKKADDKWNELKVDRLFQRNDGMIIVGKYDGGRIRMDLDKPHKPASKHLGGIVRD